MYLRPTRNLRSLTILTLVLSSFSICFGQTQKQLSSGEVYHKLEKFGVLANILYVAAHPDDENTRMITYLSNDVKANTRYLSLTRGDGGQNLIGPEIKELLGVIRTQELLAARRHDGGSQRFSRANDFGYSKNAEETIDIWDDKRVLSDVVWAIRKFRPDVIINRFDHRTSGRTHGHHTASAMLSYKAWESVGDPSAFPEQLKYVKPWQPTRQFMNTSWWFYGSREKFAQADKSNLISFDVGTYYTHRGLSNNEIAADSRSMHKCQGMGSTPQRGSLIEYLELLNGDMATDKSILGGVNTTWTRVAGGQAIKTKLEKVMAEYDFKNPSSILKDLMDIRKSIVALSDDFWKEQKLVELDEIIEACSGLFIETKVDNHTHTVGGIVDFTTEVVQRLPGEVVLKRIELLPTYTDTMFSVPLELNETKIFTHEGFVDSNAEVTAPYYLREKGSLGMYKVDDQEMIGIPETPRHFRARYTVSIYGTPMTIEKDVIYKYTDPERGEVYRPVEVVKDVYVSLPENVYIYSNGETKEISLEVKAMKGGIDAEVSIPTTDGWVASPAVQKVSFKKSGQVKTVTFKVTAPIAQKTTTLSPMVKVGSSEYTSTLIPIDYEHIPYQLVEMPCEAKFVNIDIQTTDIKIAYIPGAGDAVAANLRGVGYNVDEIDINDVTSDVLKGYNTVIMGIRAYNKWDEMRIKNDILLDYVKNGGTLISQYNTNRRIKSDKIGPYPMKLSRKRVAVEQAPIEIIATNHPIVTTPNKITQKDFEGWVQERGLYFSDEWDERYTPIFVSNDPGEDPQQGGMLHAKYGEGNFVYTGYSWFRQLPAGVPGAYRIFSNIVSLGSK